MPPHLFSVMKIVRSLNISWNRYPYFPPPPP